MRVILGNTKDTPTETMRFMLDRPSMQTRQKVQQVKGYFSAVGNPHNPLHQAVKDPKGCRLGRGKSWMGQADDSILQVCQLTEQGLGKVPKPIPASQRDALSFQNTWEITVENGQQAKQSQRSSFSFKKTANRNTS